MPILLLLIGLVGLILFLRSTNPYIDANNPMPTELQKMQEAANASVQTQTQGVRLTVLQQAQIQKFSAIASIAGTATALGIAGLSSLTLAAAGPIGAAVAGVIIAIGALRGTAHLVANQWTSGVQAQFNIALTAISGEVQRAQADGSVSKAMLTNAIKAITNLWSQYYSAGESFARIDADHRLVIDQSYCDYINYRCPSGHKPLLEIGLVNKLIADMQAASAKLKV
jgi:hypothetical protein